MNVRRRLAPFLVPTMIFAGLAGALFSHTAGYLTSLNWLRTLALEIQAASRDGGTQWMVVLCLVSYLLMFEVLDRRNLTLGAGGNNKEPDFETSNSSAQWEAAQLLAAVRMRLGKPGTWLVTFLVLVLGRYALAYATASNSLQLVVLLTSMVVGKAVGFWVGSPLARPSIHSDGGQVAASRLSVTLCITVFLLAAAALWQPDFGMQFQYLGRPRWKGPCDNPNLFGLQMGAGWILGVGLLSSLAIPSKSPSGQAPVQKRETRAWGRVKLSFLILAGAVCGYGLVKSYSRGAWLGSVLGVLYLLWSRTAVKGYPQEMMRESVLVGAGPQAGKRSRRNWLRVNWVSLASILCALLLPSYWKFRHSESPLLRRAFSGANINDFSWRNRVSAWHGSLRMVRDHPFLGVGWGQVEQSFTHAYQAERLEEPAAVQLNDYLTLANSAGLPVLLCFLIYVFLSLRWSPRVCFFPGGAQNEIGALRAVVLLLLVGFWFEGGLFKLPTSVLFWLVLALLVCTSPGPASASERAPLSPNSQEEPKPSFRSSRPLRWLAGILLLAAVGQTTLYLMLPQLQVTPRSLALARKYLIEPRATTDFDYLSTHMVWKGRTLRPLLQHVELANYCRRLVNWKLPDEVYCQFVLSPFIEPQWDGNMMWRRLLWETLYPRIRKENSPAAAAEIISRQLHRRLQIVGSGVAGDIAEIWLRKATDKVGFELITVAAMRSAGVPARLNAEGEAEYYTGTDWQKSP